MEIEKVASLQLRGAGTPIEVCIIRKWVPRLRPTDRCYLFVDIHGDAIQATSRGVKDARYVESKVSVHSCYRIQNYVFTPSTSYIKVVNHPIHLRIGEAATIEAIPPTDAFPKNYFEFRDYDDLPPLCGKNDLVTDYIGIMEAKEYRPTKLNEPMLRLTLSNSSGKRLEAALWKEIITSADRMNIQILDDTPYPAVIALTSMKVGEYLGRLQLSSSPATYLNSQNNIQHPKRGVALDSSADTKITIVELLQMDKEALTGRTFSVNGSITRFHSDQTWYYNACQHCTTTTYESGNEWACASHGKFETPRPLYKLAATIVDNTGSFTATLFNDALKWMLNKECSDLIIKDGYTDSYIIPEPIQATKDKSTKFYFHLQRDASTQVRNFSIDRASDHDIHNEQISEQSTSTMILTTPMPQSTSVRQT